MSTDHQAGPTEAVAVHDGQAQLFQERYEQLKSDPYYSAFTYTRHRIDDVCRQYLPVGAHLRLLDIGCGTGHQLRQFADLGFEVAGCDPSEMMLGHARFDQGIGRLARADAMQLPYATGVFDRGTSIEVMRYLPLGAQRRALAEIFRVLRPGGLAVITFAPKYSSNLYPLVNQVSGRVRLGGLTKVRQYFHSSRQVEQLLTDAGFAQVVVEARFFGPFVLAYRISPAAGRRLLRRWERWDRVLASTKRAANLANVFVAVARKPL